MKYFVTFQDEEYTVFSPEYFYSGVVMMGIGLLHLLANIIASFCLKKRWSEQTHEDGEQQQRTEAPIIRFQFHKYITSTKLFCPLFCNNI